MPRQFKKAKPYIMVFCEGESEQAYTDFLKEEFKEVAVIKRPRSTGLFEEADSKYKKDERYRSDAEETNEIWFFFDVETKDITKWDRRIEIIKRLRKLRKNPNIKVRLLMTTGCMEYWLMLHYEMLAPSVQTESEKKEMLARVLRKEPTYQKGDLPSTARIAEHYSTAVANARKTVLNLLQDGLPGLEDTDERNKWLCNKCMTFSTVYEAIEFLESLAQTNC